MVTAPTTLDHYPANTPPFIAPPHELSTTQARANFNYYMAIKDQRWQLMRSLLQDDSLTPAMPDSKVQELDDWYQNAVTIRPGSDYVETVGGIDCPSYRMEPIWYCIGVDLGLMLGDVSIYRFPHLKWDLCDFGGKNYSNRHRTVVRGHKRAPSKRHCIPYINLVVSHGHTCATEVDQPTRFVDLLNFVTDIA